MKKTIFYIFCSIVVLPAGVLGALYYMNQNGFFNVQKIEVVLVDTPYEPIYFQPFVQKANTAIQKFQNRSLWDVQITELYQELSQQKWINEISLARHWPNELQVRIKPQDVKLLYISIQGEYRPIIKNGDMLDPVPATKTPDVPIVKGKEFERDDSLRKKATALISELPAEGSFSQKTVSELRYDPKNGFWMSLVNNGLQVKLGDENLKMKSARVSQVIDYLNDHQFQGRVIDANFSKKVLVKLRKDP